MQVLKNMSEHTIQQRLDTYFLEHRAEEVAIEARRKANAAELYRDALRQRMPAEKFMAGLSNKDRNLIRTQEGRLWHIFDPNMFDALAPVEIEDIVKGEKPEHRTARIDEIKRVLKKLSP